jgi:cation:H+ antiporter
MAYLLLLAGLAGLAWGGDLLVRGATALALRRGLSPAVIGATLVGFGTSLPELVTSVQAGLAGAPGIAVGNVVGSNIANILLIVGLVAALRAMPVDAAALRRDGPWMVAAAVLCAGIVLWGNLGRAAGLVCLAGLALYLAVTLRRTAPAPELPPTGGLGTGLAAAAVLAGLVATVLGARALVAGAVDLAAGWGVSEALIGLTVVAVGTSLPELAAAVAAARRGAPELALGTVLGSNVFNVLGILGATALVIPLAVPASIARFDIWVMLAATAALVAVCVTGRRITRGEGALLLSAYGAYLFWSAAA